MGFMQFVQAHMWLVRQFFPWFASANRPPVVSAVTLAHHGSSHHHGGRLHRSHRASLHRVGLLRAYPDDGGGGGGDGGDGGGPGAKGTAHSASNSKSIRHNHGHTHRRRKRNHRPPTVSSPGDPRLQHFSGHPHSTETPTFGKILGLVPIQPDPNGGNWQAGFDVHDLNGTRELEFPPHIASIHPTNKEDLGSFGPNIVKVNETSIKVFNCGPIALHSVACSPSPDAFSPCEDVMGHRSLRIAVWFVVLPAVIGNLAVMIVLMSSRFRMTVSKFLMCNLAFADLCMGIYLLMLAVEDVTTVGSYFNHAIRWQHGAGCKIAGFLTVFASELSIYTLTTITLERWYAITYSIHLNRRLKLRTAAKIMVVGWAYAAIVASLPLLGVSGYTKTSICLPMENRDAVDVVYLSSLLSINGLAFVLICACYARMYSSIAGQQMANYYNGRDTTVAKRMALLVFTDFACWAPIAFFGLTAVAGYPLIDMTNSKILLVFFYPLNSCANPFLYAILTRQYRRDLFILLARYGLCTQRASKYKDASSGLGHNPHAAAPGHIRRLIRFGAASSGSSAGNSTTTNERRAGGTHCCSGGACGTGGDVSSASQGSTTASRQFSFTPNGNSSILQQNGGGGFRDREISSTSARSQGPLSPIERPTMTLTMMSTTTTTAAMTTRGADMNGSRGDQAGGCSTSSLATAVAAAAAADALGSSGSRAKTRRKGAGGGHKKRRRQPPPDLILPRHSHGGFLVSHNNNNNSSSSNNINTAATANSNSSSVSPPINGQIEMQYFCDTHI